MDRLRNVRAVVRTAYGHTEWSDRHPEGSAKAMAAMEALVRKQTDIYSVGWEWSVEDPESMACDGSRVKD